MGEKMMVLSSLKVEKLYNNYNYYVEFNRDITLLYGLNGCGKTTILNIITAIITGKLYNLINYTFSKTTLTYIDENSKNSIYDIIIIKADDNSINVKFKDESYVKIEKLSIPDDRKRRIEGVDPYYYETYPILNAIRAEFNYVYLALNRSTSLSGSSDYYNRRHYFIEEDEDILEPEKMDPEIRYVENLIFKRYMSVTSLITKLNNEFRNSILKSALDLKIQTDSKKTLPDFKDIVNTSRDISIISESYIKTLKDLNLISAEEEKEYNLFFEKYLENLRNLINQMEQTDPQDILNLLVRYNEMKKIQKIVNIAKKSEKQKAVAMQPIELFLDTVNEFISSSDFGKKVEIGTNGRVYFTTEDSEQKLSIHFLSSGEKQLLVFFANLIFGVKDTSSGIFVVDEPELSLHLSWQRVFVKKALEINSNVQFIFATHAPEIIGKNRDKMYKLEKEYAKVEEKNG